MLVIDFKVRNFYTNPKYNTIKVDTNPKYNILQLDINPKYNTIKADTNPNLPIIYFLFLFHILILN